MYRCFAIVILLLSLLPGHEVLGAEETRALRMIIVRDKQQAHTIFEQLRKGASFSAMAGRHSIGPERRTWGYSGVVPLKDMQPELQSVVRKLKPGQMSDVLELNQRFVILKVLSPEIDRHYQAADRATREKNIPQAIQELKAALLLEKDNMQTLLKLATTYDAAKRYDEAIASIEQANQYAPDITQIELLRGAIYMRAAVDQKNRTYGQKALQAYEKARQLDERLAPAVHFGIGKVYLLVLQQPNEALGHLEKAVEVTPNVAEVYRLLIQAYYDTQRYQQALQRLRMAQGLGFEFPDLRDALQKAKQEKQR
jgi:tetratricopeptide (TPR) repeat protein